MSVRGALWLILAASFLWRSAFAVFLPLGTDEAYALAVGRDFSLSFFDHPPVGFWLPAMAESLGAASPFFLRLPNLILGTVALWLLAESARELGGPRAMLWAAAIGALAPFMAMSGLMILPDAPLYVGLTGAMYALIRLAKGEDVLWLWVFGGLSLGLALASKYQAGLLPIALLIWIAATPSAWRWPLRPGFWLALALSLLGLAPVLVWNISNDWASFAFHGGRAGGGLNPANFAAMLAAQAIYLSPVVAVWAVARFGHAAAWAAPEGRLLLMIALGPILMFNGIYLFSNGTLPHWTMPGWLFVLPLIAAWLAEQDRPAPRRWLIWGAVPIHVALMVLAVHAGTGVLTAGRQSLPEWDDTVPLIPLADTRAALVESGALSGADLLAAENWIKAGHIAAALGDTPPMRVLSDDPHHFGFMAGQNATGRAVLLDITRLDRAEEVGEQLQLMAQRLDEDASPARIIPVRRGTRDYFAIVLVPMEIGVNTFDD